MQTKKTLTCIVCPRGCTLDVTLEGGSVVSISGNICQRGKTYAVDECTAPKRTVTSTIKCIDGSLVAVKTNKTVPKELIFAVMKEINAARVDADITVGDVVIKSVAGTDADVVVTGEKNV